MTTDFTRRPLLIRASSTTRGSFWKGSRTSPGIPADAILTEDGVPILAESGVFLLIES